MPGTWSPLLHQPTFGAGTALLLTDATVMCQETDTAHWWKLTPDVTGSYVNGNWSKLADGPNAPLYFASAVTRDGRVFVAGGEYNAGVSVDLLAAEIYNPITNAWTVLPTPAGWIHIGDAPCCVFPDGRIMIGSIENSQTAIFNPVTSSWAPGANLLHGSSSEATWTLLQEQTIIVCDCQAHPETEKYLIASNQWINTGATPKDLVEASSIEIGPAIALPDGRVWAIGATGQTALYSMSPISSQPGSWALGPAFPVVAGKQLGAKDAPACLLPDGLVLCAVGPVDGISADYLPPTSFFEFNPATNALAPTTNPPTNAGPPYEGRLLLLPTGQAMFVNGSNNVQVYTPAGVPDPTWRPNITSVPTLLKPGTTHTLFGRQINGLSQAVSYGDDGSMATNYPIIHIRNNASGHIFYCRTFNFSTMGINTGTVIHHAEFTIPAGATPGPSTIVVTANGIASAPVAVTVT